MTRVHQRFGVSLVLLAGLAACDPNSLNFPGRTVATNTNGEAVTIVARDVEAPEVFRETANGRWDGRPTLGGVWTSHPGAVQPERAIIRNPANGQFVVGTLFPGQPATATAPFALSSEAARALGIPAGATLPVDVTALRPEEASTVASATEAQATQPTSPTITPANPNVPTPKGLDGNAPAPAQPVSTSTDLPAKPFVQIGIFSVEANARVTAAALNTQGISTKVTKMEINGKPFWRVVAGPATSAADKQSLLSKVKAQGFSDAYFVSN